jgi:CRISPR-associated protein Csb2
MPNIAFRFPTGRYHATPWGNHVNEGLVEWPPSPWRIVRALLSTGFSKLGWKEPPPAARELVEALASTLPEYRLPCVVASHTRHFMPTDSRKPEDRTKIFDAFAHVGRSAEVGVIWPATLSPAAEALLAELVPRLSYLGRAESVVVARVVGADEVLNGDVASPSGVNRPGVEPIALLVPMAASDYASWLAEASRESGASRAGRREKGSPFPTDSLAATLVDTAFLQKHGWTQPPGSRRVFYYRPPLSTSPLRSAGPARVAQAADTALLALASDTRQRDVLPPMRRALPQAELLHVGLVSQLRDSPCPELTGRGPDGVRLEGHRHASLVPLDLDGDGLLDHFLVHARMGLGGIAQQALRLIRKTYTKGGGQPLFVTLAGIGTLQDFHRLGARRVSELSESKVWRSKTPFVPPRHLKPKRHSLEDQVQAELSARGLPAASRVEILRREEIVGLGFHRFVRTRRDPSRKPPAPCFFGLRIELEQPARGPILLGYASHFGLGLFVSAE